MAMSGKTSGDGDDNWLGGYIDSTAYGSNPKINSMPVAQLVPKEDQSEKESYSLHAKNYVSSATSRRKSMSAVDPQRTELHGNGPLKSSIVPVVECLPDRVNAIREQEQSTGHFIREHSTSQDNSDYNLSSMQVIPPGNVRRRSLDFDELEAVKERVSQVTDLWQKEKARGRESTDTISSEEGEFITLKNIQLASEVSYASTAKQELEDFQSFPKSNAGSMFKQKDGQKGKSRGFFAKLFRR